MEAARFLGVRVTMVIEMIGGDSPDPFDAPSFKDDSPDIGWADYGFGIKFRLKWQYTFIKINQPRLAEFFLAAERGR